MRFSIVFLIVAVIITTTMVKASPSRVRYQHAVYRVPKRPHAPPRFHRIRRSPEENGKYNVDVKSSDDGKGTYNVEAQQKTFENKYGSVSVGGFAKGDFEHKPDVGGMISAKIFLPN